MRPRPDDTFWGTLWREAILATSLGWNLAVPIFAGVLLGYVLDRALETGHIFTLGLLVFGVAVGYYNLMRVIQRIDRADRERQRKEKEDRR
ncbi:MAG: AtpZ/AtpI family protein [Chloroflexi bacterium]|nr:AtpZ/AtpI family protein [Chloroflexota bacterium]